MGMGTDVNEMYRDVFFVPVCPAASSGWGWRFSDGHLGPHVTYGFLGITERIQYKLVVL